MNLPEAFESNGLASGFGSTEWSLVLESGRSPRGSEALNRLCKKYWRPSYVYVRRTGLNPSDAEDVTQAFFIHLLDSDWIAKADPERGSFRAFMRTLLNYFLANHKRTQRAEKRSTIIVSIDTAEGERMVEQSHAGSGDPSVAYETAWAHSVLQASWDRLGEEQARLGDQSQFESLRPFVTQSAQPGEYDSIGARLGLNPGQVARLIHRLSRRYAEIIRSEVADTLADRSQLADELRLLLLRSAH